MRTTRASPGAKHGLFRQTGVVRPVSSDRRLIPAGRARVPPRGTGLAVAALDVPKAPLDLGLRVGAPVTAGAAHLAAGQRLRDAVGTLAVADPVVPVRFLGPQQDEAFELPGRPAALLDELFGDQLLLCLRVSFFFFATFCTVA